MLLIVWSKLRSFCGLLEKIRDFQLKQEHIKTLVENKLYCYECPKVGNAV